MAPTVAESRNARLRATCSSIDRVWDSVHYTFQSSPDPKVGCYPSPPCIRGRRICFNPHPTRRSGATRCGSECAQETGVSILTRPEGRVLRPRVLYAAPLMLFQSSPDPKVGCYTEGYALTGLTGTFQSSPDPKVGCYSYESSFRCKPRRFQSSPDPKVGCYFFPFSPPSEPLSFNPHPTRRSGATGLTWVVRSVAYVSILTRPEGRVLQTPCPLLVSVLVFQSSPDPKVGCYPSAATTLTLTGCFNPHPTRRSGATIRRI